MGAAAGAGGIGYHPLLSSTFHYDMNKVGMITIIILVVAIFMELISNKLKANA